MRSVDRMYDGGCARRTLGYVTRGQGHRTSDYLEAAVRTIGGDNAYSKTSSPSPRSRAEALVVESGFKLYRLTTVPLVAHTIENDEGVENSCTDCRSDNVSSRLEYLFRACKTT
jgi:hypothetical protein